MTCNTISDANPDIAGIGVSVLHDSRATFLTYDRLYLHLVYKP